MAPIKLKNDTYRKSRGAYSRLLHISCGNCGTYIFLYQKDGPGILKRIYLDRIYESSKYTKLENQPLKSIPTLLCVHCKLVIGIPYMYAKEKRLAFRLFVGGIVKKVVKAR